jgi:hypothetical protein
MKDFKKDVVLDKYKLDDAAAQNPSHMAYYGSEAADSRAERDALDLAVKRKRAERELYYRRNPPDDLKITEAVITALVQSDKEVQKLEDEYLTLKEETNQLEVALEAFRDKSDMVKVLTTQFSSGYFAVAQER